MEVAVNRMRATLVALSALALSGCVVAPYPYQGAGYADPAYGQPIAVANVPPPAPYAEVVPVMPFVGAVWVSGYWGWHGGRHNWVSGRWAQPRRGHYWVPHRWQPVSGRWHLSGGTWMRQH